MGTLTWVIPALVAFGITVIAIIVGVKSAFSLPPFGPLGRPLADLAAAAGSPWSEAGMTPLLFHSHLGEEVQVAVFLLLLLVAVALGLIGVVAKGPLFLLFIGIAIFAISIVVVARRGTRRTGTAGR